MPPAQITTKSGLQYVDIVSGKGPNPQSGYQVRKPCLLCLPHWHSAVRHVCKALFAMDQSQITGCRTGAAEHNHGQAV